MDLHGDALNKIIGDMDDMESKKMYPSSSGGATITITVSPSGGGDGDGDADDFPEGHDASMCGGGCLQHMSKGGEVADTAEGLPGNQAFSGGGEVLEQLSPDHDSIACKGQCPLHKDEKRGALGKKGLSMATGGEVPNVPIPASVDDMRVPPFLRKKKAV